MKNSTKVLPTFCSILTIEKKTCKYLGMGLKRSMKIGIGIKGRGNKQKKAQEAWPQERNHEWFILEESTS